MRVEWWSGRVFGRHEKPCRVDLILVPRTYVEYNLSGEVGTDAAKDKQEFDGQTIVVLGTAKDRSRFKVALSHKVQSCTISVTRHEPHTLPDRLISVQLLVSIDGALYQRIERIIFKSETFNFHEMKLKIRYHFTESGSEEDNTMRTPRGR
jgi:hypothetical protein